MTECGVKLVCRESSIFDVLLLTLSPPVPANKSHSLISFNCKRLEIKKTKLFLGGFEVILYCISSAYHGHILHLVDRLLEFQVSWILDSLELYPGYPAILLRGLKEANSSEFYCFICLFAPCSIVRIMLNPKRSTGFLSCSLRDYNFNLIFSYK